MNAADPAVTTDSGVTARREAHWNAALFRLATYLSDLTSAEAVAAAVVECARDVVGASESGVFVESGDGSLHRLAVSGALDPDSGDRFQVIPAGSRTPVRIAIDTDESLWFETDEDWSEYPDVLAGVRAVGFPSCAAVALTVGTDTLGALYATFPHAHRIAADERQVLSTLAELAAQNLRRVALAAEVGRTTAVLNALTDGMPIGVSVIDRDLRFLRVNEELARINGTPLDAHVGRTLEEVMSGLTDEVRGYFRRVLDDGESIIGRELVDPGAPHLPPVRGTAAVLASWFPIRDVDEDIVAAGVIVEDISARKTDEFRLALLAELSNLLQDTLSRDAVSERLADVLVPGLGHLAAVLVAEGSALRIEAIRGADAQRQDLAKNSVLLMPDVVEASGPLRRVLETKEPMLIADYRAGEHTDEHFGYVEAVRSLRMGSLMLLPLHTGETTHGVAIVGRSEGSVPYREDDLAFATIVARRAGMALDNARLYARLDEMAAAAESRADRFAALEATQRQIARTLQASLIPQTLPAPAGLDTAALYLATGTGVEAGGDTYDLFEVDHGWVAVIADVCGKGPEAAAITSLVRHAVRSHALYESEPAQLLEHVNEVLLHHDSDEEEPRFVTAQILLFVPGGDGVDVTVASAGHPAPVLLRGADASVVDCKGNLLGVMPSVDARSVQLTLDTGDALVLYTDGVTEARDAAGAQFGEDAVVDTIRRSGRAAGSARALIDDLETAVRRHATEGLRDDVAVVAFRVR